MIINPYLSDNIKLLKRLIKEAEKQGHMLQIRDGFYISKNYNGMPEISIEDTLMASYNWWEALRVYSELKDPQNHLYHVGAAISRKKFLVVAKTADDALRIGREYDLDCVSVQRADPDTIAPYTRIIA